MRMNLYLLACLMIALLLLTSVDAGVVLAASPSALLDQAPPPPPPVPTEPSPDPHSTPSSRSRGGESDVGGGSRFPHCNSTVKGLVTNYAGTVPGSGVTIEAGNSGWHSRLVTDSNGHYEFNGLCEGAAYLRVLLPEGALSTNPNAEASLDGANTVQVDLGFFPPAPITVSPPLEAPSDAAGLDSQRAAADDEVLADEQPIAEAPQPGISIKLNGGRSMVDGEPAEFRIVVKNGGPQPAANLVVTLPLPSGIALEEANTSRGRLRIQTEGSSGRALMLGSRNAGSSLVIDGGSLPAGEALLIGARLGRKGIVQPGNSVALQAQVSAGGVRYKSDVVSVALRETADGPAASLAATTAGDYRRAIRDLLW